MTKPIKPQTKSSKLRSYAIAPYTLAATAALLASVAASATAHAACDARYPQFRSAKWATPIQVVPDKDGKLDLIACDDVRLADKTFAVRLGIARLSGLAVLPLGNRARYAFASRDGVVDLGDAALGFCMQANAERCQLKFEDLANQDLGGGKSWRLSLFVTGHDEPAAVAVVRPDIDSPTLINKTPPTQ